MEFRERFVEEVDEGAHPGVVGQAVGDLVADDGEEA